MSDGYIPMNTDALAGMIGDQMNGAGEGVHGKWQIGNQHAQRFRGAVDAASTSRSAGKPTGRGR